MIFKNMLCCGLVDYLTCKKEGGGYYNAMSTGWMGEGGGGGPIFDNFV